VNCIETFGSNGQVMFLNAEKVGGSQKPEDKAAGKFQQQPKIIKKVRIQLVLDSDS